MTTRPEGESQKVPKLMFVADEVIVAKLPWERFGENQTERRTSTEWFFM